MQIEDHRLKSTGNSIYKCTGNDIFQCTGSNIFEYQDLLKNYLNDLIRFNSYKDETEYYLQDSYLLKRANEFQTMFFGNISVYDDQIDNDPITNGMVIRSFIIEMEEHFNLKDPDLYSIEEKICYETFRCFDIVNEAKVTNFYFDTMQVIGNIAINVCNIEKQMSKGLKMQG